MSNTNPVVEAARELPPVKMSASAHNALVKNMRRWSGWDDARLKFGEPDSVSPLAVTDTRTREITVNVDLLLRNPNRILKTVNPFRLRQEAFLTGAMLHEAGHARHSKWLPNSPEAAAVKPALHSDGTAPSQATIDFAVMMEEPRIEGLMVRDARDAGAVGLEWTMRAMASHYMPMTDLTGDADADLMRLINSWSKRAGRLVAVKYWYDERYRSNPTVGLYQMPNWVGQFTALLTEFVADRLMTLAYETEHGDPSMVNMQTQVVLDTLRSMCKCDDDTGPTMLDHARDILAILFPETPPDQMPSMGGGCGSMGEPDDNEEDSNGAAQAGQTADESESEAGEDGSQGDSEDGEGDDSAEQGSGGGESQSEGDEPGDGTGAGQGGASGDASEGDGESDGEGQGSEAKPPLTEQQVRALADTLKRLEQIEDAEQSETKAEARVRTVEAPVEADPTIRGAGSGDGTGIDGGWRRPKPEERVTADNAGRFLRDLIDPTEKSITSLSDAPSAQVDAAALAAWRAGGQHRDPRFFQRTRRDVTPAPPVKVAVLVDVSESMGVLQKPSALLSWALANAALDLANFAGRGTQVTSTLIHWGNVARVVQPAGGRLPGLREVVCREGTSAMHKAFDLIEEQIPGFFDVSDKPENRLIVQFTDWDLANSSMMREPLRRALSAGVNMLTIGPAGYHYRSDLPWLLREVRATTLAGRSHEVVYNHEFPEAVWDEAARMLR